MRRVHILYAGTVQGVGFRYSARRAAANLGLSGFVRNLPNGNVELVCEGPEPLVRDLIKDIDMLMGDYISDSIVQWGRATGEHGPFRISF